MQLSLEMIAKVAKSPANDPMRAKAEAMWPGWAKFIRQAGDSAVLLGTQVDALDFKQKYGGSLPDDSPDSPVDAVLESVGRVVTISARTIRPEARLDPEYARAAQKAVRSVLDQIPQSAATDYEMRTQIAPQR